MIPKEPRGENTLPDRADLMRADPDGARFPGPEPGSGDQKPPNAEDREEASAESRVTEDLAALNGYAGDAELEAEIPDDQIANPEVYAAWVALVERIRTGEIDGMMELYDLFSKGIRFYLCRHLGPQELDDKVHDTFVVVVQAIKRGELREPQRLMGFVRTIVRRQVAAHIDKVVHTRRDQLDMDSSVRIVDPRGNPEEAAMGRQRNELIARILDELNDRDREILTRFYLREQTQDEICTEMALSETQFRLLKSRAKQRFGELGKKKLAARALHAIFVRTSAGLSH